MATNAARIALDNRLLGKPNTENGVSREILFFEIARNYSFDQQRAAADLGRRPVTTTTRGRSRRCCGSTRPRSSA